jgi:RimJ/RimL family protein N-acetyltransferase
MEFKLRKWNEADLDSLVKYANNCNVAKWLTNSFPYPYTREDGKAYLAVIENDNPVKVFAIEVNGGETVGSIGIFPQADIHEKSAEIGYWLAEEYWGQGIMAQAIQEIVAYGFRTFDVVRIFARPFSTNLNSQRVLEKAGFTLEARLKKALFKNGEFMDELIYAKFKD